MLSEKEFTELFRAKLKEIEPFAQFRITQDLHIKITYEACESTAFLFNAYNEYKMDPEGIDTLFDRYIASALETLEHSGSREGLIDTERIVPVIKDKGYIDEILVNLSKNN